MVPLRDSLSVMAFRVKFTEKQDKLDEYETADSYSIIEGGVLAIKFGDEAKWTEYYPPGRWVQVIAEPNHTPGRPGGSANLRDTVL